MKNSSRERYCEDEVIASLEETPAVVLLGGPGSGKSTITRYLAWSYAQANISPTGSSQFPDCLLPGNPIPLRIELRRFAEDRRQRPSYDFFSYATEILLGRSGLIVNRHMFEMLLERRLMLLLFDGLDEVATLDERRKLIEEIEEIAQRYPGNRMLITSRPVGYDLIRFSSQFFSHIHIQLFNDEQIRLFLTNWYAHVLRLPVLSAEDQRERDGLYRTLQENPRLHTLAENPLLLTVITSPHRYERLPDRRIRIYDRCADLLLETWAKLRGTDGYWKDMKMSQEDQYACVAHLGYVLHKRSQDDQRTGAHTNDVSARFMLREIEHFLRSRGLIIEAADQHKEAKRFLDLVQVEAGIIIEHGKDEHGDDLYGFIHRTFQEYFAAADVYERYQQEEDPAIIRVFLREHLHDPHWREVVLLLLGKLKRKPVTALLHQLIEGALKCRLSRYTDILQQDLFFVCSCLIEEITVERDVVDAVIFGLSHLIGASSFPAQRKAALDCLYALTQKRQYREVARQEVATLMTQYETLPLPIMLFVVQTFCTIEEVERLQKVKQAIEVLSLLIRRKNLFAEHVIQIAELANTWRIEFSEGLFEQRERQALQDLIDSPRRFEESDEHSFKLFEHFYNADISLTENEDALSDQQMVGVLLRRLRRGHLPAEQAVLLAETVYTQSLGRYEQRYAAQLLLHIASHPLLPLERFFRVAQTL